MPAEYFNDIIWAEWEADLHYEDFQEFKKLLKAAQLPRRYPFLVYADNRLSSRNQYQVNTNVMTNQRLRAHRGRVNLFYDVGVMVFSYQNEVFLICAENSIKFYKNYDRRL